MPADPDTFEELLLGKLLTTAMTLANAAPERRAIVFERIRTNAARAYQRAGYSDIESFFASDALLPKLEAIVARRTRGAVPKV